MKESMSFVCGTSDQPLIYRTVGDVLSHAAEQWGDREAIVVRHQAVRWSYREFAREVDKFAAGLLALELEIGAPCQANYASSGSIRRSAA